jgi:hypothetical protein
MPNNTLDRSAGLRVLNLLGSARLLPSPRPVTSKLGDGDTPCMSDANRLLVFDAGPLEGLGPFPEREILDDLAITKHEAIGKSSANPFGRVS